ncbi:Zinc finger C2H2 superfamily [Arabidopsis suecica]|uniref:Zinc finger C2H2 superfamily n=1 Tax=Arabidopsis suecica TaxID=45249 RepID=A0A8T1ZTP5_ARASU|nr:Zinc finger C2H2 superfamily [Arabidopsis suecica]
MEFWEVKVKARESLKVEPGFRRVFLCQAFFGEDVRKGINDGPVYLYAKVNGKKYVLAILSRKHFPLITFDLIMEKDFVLSHSMDEGVIHLTGYKTPPGYKTPEVDCTVEEEEVESRYVKSKTTVWWDIERCPLPHVYDASLVGPCIDRALQYLGYLGPISITAIGNLKHTPDHVLRALSSSGILVKHVPNGTSCIFAQLFAWELQSRPPATFMLISDSPVRSDLHHSLESLEEKGYNILVVYRHKPQPGMITSFQWLQWESLLANTCNTQLTRKRQLLQESARFSCTLCHVAFQSRKYFETHLKGEKHEMNEYLLGPDSPFLELNIATTMTEQLKTTLENVVVNPGADSSQYKGVVWWDIDRCPVPNGYDASLVGPRMLQSFGFYDPLTIIAIGSLRYTSCHVMRAISSSGIVSKHVPFGGPSIIEDVLTWANTNPPPAKIILVTSSSLMECMSPALYSLKEKGYNILLACTQTLPEGLNRYVNWRWEDLLAVPLGNRPETRRHKDELSSCFICTTCDLSYESYESFDIHMGGEEHAMRAFRIGYYYLNQEPGSGTRYSPAVKKLSKEGLNISSFLTKLMSEFIKSKLNKQVDEADSLTTATVKKQSKRKLKKRRIK